MLQFVKISLIIFFMIIGVACSTILIVGTGNTVNNGAQQLQTNKDSTQIDIGLRKNKNK